MNALCNPQPPPKKLCFVLKQQNTSEDADLAWAEIHRALHGFNCAITSTLKDNGHYHVCLNGDTVLQQEQLIFDAITFIAHGHWKIIEGGDTCQASTT